MDELIRARPFSYLTDFSALGVLSVHILVIDNDQALSSY
jgi:hypothetical protein